MCEEATRPCLSEVGQAVVYLLLFLAEIDIARDEVAGNNGIRVSRETSTGPLVSRETRLTRLRCCTLPMDSNLRRRGVRTRLTSRGSRISLVGHFNVNLLPSGKDQVRYYEGIQSRWSTFHKKLENSSTGCK